MQSCFQSIAVHCCGRACCVASNAAAACCGRAVRTVVRVPLARCAPAERLRLGSPATWATTRPGSTLSSCMPFCLQLLSEQCRTTQTGGRLVWWVFEQLLGNFSCRYVLDGKCHAYTRGPRLRANHPPAADAPTALRCRAHHGAKSRQGSTLGNCLCCFGWVGLVWWAFVLCVGDEVVLLHTSPSTPNNPTPSPLPHGRCAHGAPFLRPCVRGRVPRGGRSCSLAIGTCSMHLVRIAFRHVRSRVPRGICMHGHVPCSPWRVLDTPPRAAPPTKQHGHLLPSATWYACAWARFMQSVARARRSASRITPQPSSTPNRAARTLALECHVVCVCMGAFHGVRGACSTLRLLQPLQPNHTAWPRGPPAAWRTTRGQAGTWRMRCAAATSPSPRRICK